MNADDARKILLVRAFESPLAAPWTEADVAWASAEAARLEGSSAAPDRLLARRAEFALQRLAGRAPAVPAALKAADGFGWAWLLVPIALAFGLAIDAIGPAGRLNIVALPLLGVLGWNLIVYLLLVLQAVRGIGLGAIGRRLQDLMALATRRLPTREPDTAPALARFFADWTRTGAPLHAHRIAAVLHAAAAALALGMLASLYLRGLAFEYRAGWDSTFLGPEAVHRLLSVVMAPALALAGGELPGVERIAALRFTDGPGENAAPWIHLLALTVLLLVLLPRNLLVLWSAWRVRRLERDLPVPLDEPYFRRLLPRSHGSALAVRVLPYSYALDPARHPPLAAALERLLDADVVLQVAPNLPLGAEDTLDAPAIDGEDLVLLPLLALTATPERDTHGAFLAALAARRDGEWRQLVLIDESGFRAFDETRRAQRRAAWQAMLDDLGLKPAFIDLGA